MRESLRSLPGAWKPACVAWNRQHRLGEGRLGREDFKRGRRSAGSFDGQRNAVTLAVELAKAPAGAIGLDDRVGFEAQPFIAAE
jgi:hypothetical protein